MESESRAQSGDITVRTRVEGIWLQENGFILAFSLLLLFRKYFHTVLNNINFLNNYVIIMRILLSFKPHDKHLSKFQ